MTTPEPVIVIDQLQKSYGKVQAVRGISMSVERGEIFGFLGPNGAGKTTTIRCMLDVIRPSAGTIRVLGLDAQRDALALHQRIGYLPGDVRLPGQMTGKQEFGLKVTWDRDRIIEELKREHEEIRRFHQELTRKHLQSTYFARMQLGRMIDKALTELSASYVRDIYEGLRTVCVASKDNKPIGDKMILNASFLIEKERESEFDAAVTRVARKFRSLSDRCRKNKQPELRIGTRHCSRN